MSEALLERLTRLTHVARVAATDAQSALEWSTNVPHRHARELDRDNALDAAARELTDTDALLEWAHRTHERLYYKMVAKVNGRYLSVFDGATEFRIGAAVSRDPCHGHRGAFFAYDDLQSARRATFPKKSALAHAELVLLLVLGDEPHADAQRSHGAKRLLWSLTPLLELGPARLPMPREWRPIRTGRQAQPQAVLRP